MNQEKTAPVAATASNELPEILQKFVFSDEDIRGFIDAGITKNQTIEGARFELAVDEYVESILDEDEEYNNVVAAFDGGNDVSYHLRSIREIVNRINTREDIVKLREISDAIEP